MQLDIASGQNILLMSTGTLPTIPVLETITVTLLLSSSFLFFNTSFTSFSHFWTGVFPHKANHGLGLLIAFA
jgi:hypothetical protein